jgi:hypothetical protein
MFSLIEKGKFIDFWESKRAKRQYSKFPFKMRGKHKIVTLMNLEIPLKRISTKENFYFSLLIDLNCSLKQFWNPLKSLSLTFHHLI